MILHSIMVSFMIEDTLIFSMEYTELGCCYSGIHMIHNHVVITLFYYPNSEVKECMISLCLTYVQKDF